MGSAVLLQEDSWVCSRLALSSDQYCAECEDIDFAILEIEIILTFPTWNARENLTIFKKCLGIIEILYKSVNLPTGF